MDIAGFVSEKMGIDQSQSKGAVGLLLNLAKGKMGGDDFAKVTEAVPEADELIDAAPKPGGIAEALGGLTSALGGGGIGKLADMAGGLSKLGLDAGQIGGLVQTVLSFFKQGGKTEAADLLQKAMD